MKSSDNSKEKLDAVSGFIIAIHIVIFLASIFIIGPDILNFLSDKLGYIVCIIIFFAILKWPSNQENNGKMNNKEENINTRNANYWTEDELNMIYRVRFLREQKERYEKEKNDTKE